MKPKWTKRRGNQCNIFSNKGAIIIVGDDGKKEGFTLNSTIKLSENKVRIAVETLVIVGLLATYFTTDITVVSGISMNPTYSNGQILVGTRIPNDVDKLLVEKNTIVKFMSPEGDVAIKRIIATPGDKVEYQGAGVYINGKYIGDSNAHFIKKQQDAVTNKHRLNPNETFTLKQNEYFVAGDNRENSVDSREYGPITDYSILAILKK